MKMSLKTEGLKRHLRQLQSMGKSPRRELQRAATAGGKVIAEEANRLAPGPHISVRTAKRQRGYVEVDIAPTKKYWYYRYIETGAQPHEISARSASELVFLSSAFGIVMTRRVHHPGMAARPFLRPAADSKWQDAARAVGDVFWQMIEAAAK